uniref:RNA helicase n=1 Tax=Oryza punctata TaxID=4537 RepID=A0A0E0JXF8_ORYPU
MAQQGHNMDSECVEKEQVSTQAMGTKSSENKAVQGQAFTGLSNKRKCFALKVQVSKFWKLTDWEIRTEGRKGFVASFNSEDDLVSCLKTPRVETSIDDKEVNFTVARWKEDDEENIELIREWFLVYGVPRICRNWKELYQIVSAVGVLTDVDEESLEDDHEPIKLKVALRSVDGAPFSCHFVFGWYSRCITFMIEDKAQTKEGEKVLEVCNGEDHLDEFGKEYRAKPDEVIEIPPEILNKLMNSESSSNDTIVVSTHNHTLDVKGWSDKELEKTAEREQSISESSTSMIGDTVLKEATVIHSKKTTEDTAKAEWGQSTSGKSTGMIGEAHFRGQIFFLNLIRRKIHAYTLIVYARRDRRSMEKQDSKRFLEKVHRKEMEAHLVGEGQKSDNESGGDGNNKDSNAIAPSAIAINSKKKQTTKDIVTTQGTQSISESSIGETQEKGVGMAGTRTGGDDFEKQHVSKMSKQDFSTQNGIFESFNEVGLQENLQEGIYAYGLDKPCVVHRRGIVPLCNGLDIIQQSFSGTTVTLCCGVLQRLDYASTECQALVLVPTRVKAHAFYGGTSVHEDQRILSRGVQVAVGTRCHVLGMLQGRTLCPDHIRMFVLDEADEVLRGFRDKVHNIIQLLPTKTQYGFFSASMSHEALEMSRKFMNKPVEIIVPRDEELEGINVKQFYVNVEKEDELCGLFNNMEITQSIIFVNTRCQAKSLTEKIGGKGYTVSAIHGGIHQGARDKAVQEFQSGLSRILIATDLRGIDVLHAPVTMIYDLPAQPVSYLRHVQRSGQHGGKGVVISFITRADERVFSSIQKFTSAQIEELPSNVADLL